MTEHVLTLNAGSSSIKFALFAVDPAGGDGARVFAGQVERIGGEPVIKAKGGQGEPKVERALPAGAASDHAGACAAILSLIEEQYPGVAIPAVGHRVVHGGTAYATPMLLDDAVLSELERFSPFAPLHQPHNLAAVRAARTAFPAAIQVACFDTAFHRNHPWVNDTFALPRSFYDKGVRRYGFHGLSYEFIAGRLAEIAPTLHAGRVVVAHLGNGASMCGLLAGRSIGSTMGFSALDGLPMGTRSGQLDPGVILYLLQQEGMSAEDIVDLLYRKSGLLGLSGLSNDMRTLEAAGTPEARDAIDYFVFRVRRELGALTAVLGGLDALVFTGGIGENSANVRRQVCDGLGWFGIEIDRAANAEDATVISTPFSRARVLVLATDEERVIARAASGFVAEGRPLAPGAGPGAGTVAAEEAVASP
ncbi:MAG: acetate/propionate family kinase [Pseudomonadota bacterium]